MFVIANSLKGGDVLDDLLKEYTHVWEGLLASMFKDREEFWKKKLEEKDFFVVSTMLIFYNLELVGIMKHNVEDYWEWYYIRKEYWTIEIEIEKKIMEVERNG
jgi:hypothetical protein